MNQPTPVGIGYDLPPGLASGITGREYRRTDVNLPQLFPPSQMASSSSAPNYQKDDKGVGYMASGAIPDMDMPGLEAPPPLGYLQPIEQPRYVYKGPLFGPRRVTGGLRRARGPPDPSKTTYLRKGVQVPYKTTFAQRVAAYNANQAKTAAAVAGGWRPAAREAGATRDLKLIAGRLRPPPTARQQAAFDRNRQAINLAKQTYVLGSGKAAWMAATARARQSLGIVGNPQTRAANQARKARIAADPAAAAARAALAAQKAAGRANRALEKAYGKGVGPRFAGVRTQATQVARQITGR